MIEADEDPPAYFHETKWPHPRLVRNKPQGEDEALVWVLAAGGVLVVVRPAWPVRASFTSQSAIMKRGSRSVSIAHSIGWWIPEKRQGVRI